MGVPRKMLGFMENPHDFKLDELGFFPHFRTPMALFWSLKWVCLKIGYIPNEIAI